MTVIHTKFGTRWRRDWENAPTNRNFLVKLRGGLVSTAAYYWESDHWGLHDIMRDEPLEDDGGPTMRWMEVPT